MVNFPIEINPLVVSLVIIWLYFFSFLLKPQDQNIPWPLKGCSNKLSSVIFHIVGGDYKWVKRSPLCDTIDPSEVCRHDFVFILSVLKILTSGEGNKGCTVCFMP